MKLGLGQLGSSCDPVDFCLKIYGRVEYLVEDLPVFNYTSILEEIESTATTFLVMKNTDLIVRDLVKVNSHESFLNSQTLKIIETDSSWLPQEKSKLKPCQMSSTEIKDKFLVEIGEVKCRELVRSMKGEIYLRMSIYHGNVEITKRVDTLVSDILSDESDLTDENQKKSKCIDFNLPVCNIPRNGRLCCGLFMRDKKGKPLPLGWANRTIFNYNGIMRQSYSMFLWEDDEPSHEVLNPYKTTEENYRTKDSTTLDVNFLNTFQCTVVFPEEQPITIEVGLKSW